MYKPSEESLSLKVLDAYYRDLGKGIARMDMNSMKFLRVSEHDLVEVKAKRIIVARCEPRDASDKSVGNLANVIRIDQIQREEIGAAVGDTVVVKKCSKR